MNTEKKYLIIYLIYFLGSCTSIGYPKNTYKLYYPAKSVTQNGKFYAGLEPRPKLVENNGNEISVWESPYHLNIQFYSKEGKALLGDIKNVRLISKESGVTVYERDYLMDSVRRRGLAPKPTMSLAFGEVGLSIPYEDYRLIFEYKIFVDKETLLENGELEIPLEKNYYVATSRRVIYLE